MAEKPGQIPDSPDEWKSVAKDFEEKWNFPNCIGAIDGKHIVMQAPMKSGSLFYNYKNTFSVVLMALVDANYRFIYIDVGANGRVSDGGVFKECTLNRALVSGTLNLPDAQPLSSEGTPIPYVMVGDEAFPLKENIMKPYPVKVLDNEKRIFNYRLSRARRVVENAFGILANRFRVFRAPIPLSPEKVEHIVLCACALHNLMRPDAGYANNENDSTPSAMTPFTSEDRPGNHSSSKSRIIREEFTKYFISAGQVPWQYRVLSDIV